MSGTLNAPSDAPARSRDETKPHRAARQSAVQIVTSSGLPAPLMALLATTVKGLRLWPAERADIARELVSHMHEGLAAGTAPADLAATFGDPAASAKLLTRSRKRLRPRWYRAVRGTFNALAIGLGVLALGFALAAARYQLGRPSISTDYLAQINERIAQTPPSQRAWPLYVQAIHELPSLAPDGDDTIEKSVRNSMLARDLESSEARAALAYVASAAPVLAKVRAAAAMPAAARPVGFDVSDIDLWKRPGAGTPPPPPSPQSSIVTTTPGAGSTERYTGLDGALIGTLLPQLREFRTFARLLVIEARAAGRAGNVTLVMDDLKALGGLARHAAEPGSTIIGQLVGLAINDHRIATIHLLLDDHPRLFSDAQLVELAHELAAWRANPVANNDTIELTYERLNMLDMLQRLYTDDGNGNGRLARGGVRGLRGLSALSTAQGQSDISTLSDGFVGPAMGFIVADRAATRARYDEYLASVESQMALPPWQRDFKAAHAVIDEEAGLGRVRYLLVHSMAPALWRTGLNIDRARTLRDGAQARIAVELYKRQAGKLPTSLADLTPRLLPSIPLDPWDGQPLRLVVRDGSLVLYSIGADKLDHQGTPPPEGQGDTAIAPVRTLPGQPPVPADWILWSIPFTQTPPSGADRP